MVVAYPVMGKAKSLEICRAFVEGCGGAVAQKSNGLVSDDIAFFYGVDASNQRAFDQALERRSLSAPTSFYYCDNSYFDATRQRYFRVTRNALQYVRAPYEHSTGERYCALELPPIQPWRTGNVIVACPQSEHFMRNIAKEQSNWLEAKLAVFTLALGNPIHVRAWSPDKGALASTLEHDLRDAYALVTYSSAAAITALLHGVPVFCDQSCAVHELSSPMESIAAPHCPSQRQEVFNVLADHQWTLDEMRKGVCWKGLHS